MAASGYTPIILLNSTTTGNTPTTSNLAVGELAINVTDGKLFFNQSGTIKVLANATYATSVSTISFGTTGLTPSTATNGVVTVAGTLNVANGGTGVTTSTGSGSNVLNTSPSLVTPDLGTPSSVTLTNATGLPLTTGVTGTLPVANGGTGLTSFTANGVVYASSTSALATGSALVFTGTNLGIGTSSPASQLQVSSSGNTPIDITSTGTGAVWTRYNTSTYYFDIGINNSAGTTFSTDAYANVLWGANNYPIVFATNNTERMRLTSAGYLGIGTSSPSTKLQVSGGAITFSSGGSGGIFGDNDASYSILQASSTANAAAIYLNGTARTSFGSYLQYAGSLHQWFNASLSTEWMRIDSSGNLLVGTTTASEKLTVNGRASFGGYIYPSVDNAYSCGLGGNRWSVIYSATALINTSDEREKTEIVDSPLGLNFVMSLKPVAYKFKTGGNNVSEDGAITPIEGKRQHFGLLAQQVKEVCGNIDFGGWVLTNKNDPNSTQGLRYDEFIAPMIKAIQELSAKVTALEAKLGV